MALIAHWPLNGNTNDISGNGYNGTPTNITYAAGKIGQAASFNGTNSFVNCGNPSAFDIALEGSISVWVYSNTEYPGTGAGNSFRGIVAKTQGGSAGQQTYYIDWYGTSTSGARTLRFGLGNTSTARVLEVTNIDLFQKWTHISATWNSNNLILYINGAEVNRTTTLIVPQNRPDVNLEIGRAFGFAVWNGRINDVRLFNYTLTDMEIQEIARAKILHYSFDDFQEPTTNLIPSNLTNFESVIPFGVGAGTNWEQANHVDSGQTILNPNGIISKIYNVSDEGFIFIDVSNINTSITYTGSLYVYSSHDYTFRLRWNGNFTSTFVPARKWTKIENTQTGVTAARLLVGYRDSDAAANPPSGFQVAYSMAQVESKAYSTEFTIGSRTGRVNDYSGFFNNSILLTETNTPRWIPEAKVGTGAYQFSSSRRILTSTINLGNGNNEWTATAWVKTTTTVNSLGTGSVFSNQSGGPVYSLMGVNGGKIVYWTYQNNNWSQKLGNAVVNDGNWHFLTWVNYSNYTMNMYVDGILDANVANSTSGNNNPIDIIGASWTASFDGSIDDPKIYMTALSDKDILDLYNTKAEIEQSGVLYARDFLSNAEETVNLIESIGTVVRSTKVGNGVLINWTSNFGDTYFFFNLRNGLTLTTGDQYTISFDCTGKPDDKTVVFNWANIAGLGITLKNGRNSLTFNVPSDTRAFLDDSVRDNTINNLYLYNFQLERKDHPTPFVSTFRPAIELPTGVQFGADEIHETGIANFEDFSTVGITDGLVAYYPLDKNAYDYAGLNGEGTINGATNVGGIINGAYNFNGTSNFISLNSEGLPYGSSPGTISAWGKTNTISAGFQWLISYGSPTLSQARFVGLNNSTFYFGGYGNDVTFPGAQVNEWFHICGVYDGTTAYLYINGNLVSYTAKSWNTVQSVARIGRQVNTASEYFNGVIDDVKIFNRALTAEEIKIEYNYGKKEVQIHESGVVYARDLEQY